MTNPKPTSAATQRTNVVVAHFIAVRTGINARLEEDRASPSYVNQFAAVPEVVAAVVAGAAGGSIGAAAVGVAGAPGVAAGVVDSVPALAGSFSFWPGLIAVVFRSFSAMIFLNVVWFNLAILLSVSPDFTV
jgi:hypothetical protein